MELCIGQYYTETYQFEETICNLIKKKRNANTCSIFIAKIWVEEHNQVS